MNPLTAELIALCRFFGVVERETICCGTVSVQQCVALQDLSDGQRDITALARSSGTSMSAMTRLVDGLERRGWVQRERDTEDRRRVVVTLTTAGTKEAKRLHELTDVAVRAVLERIPKDKRAQVVESIGLVRQALADARQSLAPCCGAPTSTCDG